MKVSTGSFNFGAIREQSQQDTLQSSKYIDYQLMELCNKLQKQNYILKKENQTLTLRINFLLSDGSKARVQTDLSSLCQCQQCYNDRMYSKPMTEHECSTIYLNTQISCNSQCNSISKAISQQVIRKQFSLEQQYKQYKQNIYQTYKSKINEVNQALGYLSKCYQQSVFCKKSNEVLNQVLSLQSKQNKYEKLLKYYQKISQQTKLNCTQYNIERTQIKVLRKHMWKLIQTIQLLTETMKMQLINIKQQIKGNYQTIFKQLHKCMKKYMGVDVKLKDDPSKFKGTKKPTVYIKPNISLPSDKNTTTERRKSTGNAFYHTPTNKRNCKTPKGIGQLIFAVNKSNSKDTKKIK